MSSDRPPAQATVYRDAVTLPVTWRRNLVELRYRTLPILLHLLRRFAPMRQVAAVAGYPATEGNAVETVRALLAHYDGPIAWLDGPGPAYLDALGITGHAERVRWLRKNSVRGLWAFLTAEAVFFTHGVFSLPPVDARKLTVNLWHGSGIKQKPPLFSTRRVQGKPSDFIVGTSRLWGLHLAECSDLSPADAILSGFPRNDDLFRPCSDAVLADVGVTGPFVVWMPTHRREHLFAGRRTDPDALMNEVMAVGAPLLAEHGFTLVVKPHTYDNASREIQPAVLLDDRVLQRAGTSLYSFLARSAALIADASSTWNDYLLLDRPIGFAFPDRDHYAVDRPVYPPDVMGWLPGLDLTTDPQTWLAFIRDVESGGADSADRRAELDRRAGIVRTTQAAEDLLRQLKARSDSRFASHLTIA